MFSGKSNKSALGFTRHWISEILKYFFKEYVLELGKCSVIREHYSAHRHFLCNQFIEQVG